MTGERNLPSSDTTLPPLRIFYERDILRSRCICKLAVKRGKRNVLPLCEFKVYRIIDGETVAAREGKMVVSAFHPELTADLRFHRFFLDIVAGKR
jgi:hypothetical protein